MLVFLHHVQLFPHLEHPAYFEDHLAFSFKTEILCLWYFSILVISTLCSSWYLSPDDSHPHKRQAKEVLRGKRRPFFIQKETMWSDHSNEFPKTGHEKWNYFKLCDRPTCQRVHVNHVIDLTAHIKMTKKHFFSSNRSSALYTKFTPLVAHLKS